MRSVDTVLRLKNEKKIFSIFKKYELYASLINCRSYFLTYIIESHPAYAQQICTDLKFCDKCLKEKKPKPFLSIFRGKNIQLLKKDILTRIV